MKRILIVADDPTLVTGYARLGRFLAETLMTDYEVRYLPCNAFNPNHDRKFKYMVDSFEPSERYNNHRIGDILQSFQPSLVIVIGEFVYIGYIGNVCRQLGIKSMYYMPVEGLNFPPHIVYVGSGQVDYKLTLSKFDYIVAYSNFGKEQIHKQLPGIVTEVIYHPINTDIFRPLDRERCRKMYLAHLMDNPEIKDPFIVGAVYRNMRRKGVDYLIKGFKSFVDKYETDRKAFLFLLMDYRESAGYNLYQMLEQYGLREKFILVPSVGGVNGPDDHGLCELYNTFDVHCCPFRAEGWGLCVDWNAKITLPFGETKNLNEIAVGDNVLSEDGNVHRVLGTNHRKVDEYISVSVLSGSIPKLKVTEEHELLVAKIGDRRGACFEDFRWTKAKEIKVKNWLFLPKPKWEEKETQKIVDLTAYVDNTFNNWKADGEYVYNSMGYSPKTNNSYKVIIKKYNVTKTSLEDACGHLKRGTEPKKGGAVEKSFFLLKELIKKNEWAIPKAQRYKRHINLFSNDALYLFGWYIAEGSAGKSKFELSCGENDVKYFDKIFSCIESVFGVNKEDIIINRRKSSRSIRIIVCGPHGQMLKALFGGNAHEKAIPPYFFDLPLNSIAWLVRGVWLGDGCTSITRRTNTYSSVSTHLITQLSYILKCAGIYNVVGNDMRGGLVLRCISGSENNFYKFVNIPCFIRKAQSRAYAKFAIPLEEGFAIRVSDVEKVNEPLDVGDLWVEGVHSYVANEIVVHNCIMESLGCGVRTIATNFSSPGEYGKGVLNFVEPIDTEPIVSTNCEWAVLDYKDVGKAIAKVYNDKQEVYQKGVDLANTLSEPLIGKQWLRLLRDLNLPEKPHEVIEQSKNVRENIIDTYVDLL